MPALPNIASVVRGFTGRIQQEREANRQRQAQIEQNELQILTALAGSPNEDIATRGLQGLLALADPQLRAKGGGQSFLQRFLSEPQRTPIAPIFGDVLRQSARAAQPGESVVEQGQAGAQQLQQLATPPVPQVGSRSATGAFDTPEGPAPEASRLGVPSQPPQLGVSPTAAVGLSPAGRIPVSAGSVLRLSPNDALRFETEARQQQLALENQAEIQLSHHEIAQRQDLVADIPDDVMSPREKQLFVLGALGRGGSALTTEPNRQQGQGFVAMLPDGDFVPIVFNPDPAGPPYLNGRDVDASGRPTLFPPGTQFIPRSELNVGSATREESLASGRPFAAMTPAQRQRLLDLRDQRRVDVAGQSAFVSGQQGVRGRSAGEQVTPISPDLARSIQVPFNTLQGQLSGITPVSDDARERHASARAILPSLENIQRMIPEVFVEVAPEDWTQLPATQRDLLAQRMRASPRYAALQGAVALAVGQVARVLAAESGRLTEQDVQRAQSALVNLNASLLNGDTVHSAQARLAETVAGVQRVIDDIQTENEQLQQRLGTPPPTGGAGAALPTTSPDDAAAELRRRFGLTPR